jgi:hypothetical protein
MVEKVIVESGKAKTNIAIPSPVARRGDAGEDHQGHLYISRHNDTNRVEVALVIYQDLPHDRGGRKIASRCLVNLNDLKAAAKAILEMPDMTP